MDEKNEVINLIKESLTRRIELAIYDTFGFEAKLKGTVYDFKQEYQVDDEAFIEMIMNIEDEVSVTFRDEDIIKLTDMIDILNLVMTERNR